MTEPNSQTQPAADPNAQVVNPQAIYIKDCSFEAPNGPFISNGQGNPSVNLNLTTRATALAQDMHEVVLQVNLEAKAGDKVVWLLELQQAGAFLIRNLSAAELAQVVSIMAPNYLLAFARATVAELVAKGGFPPFLLPLVTFEALHARAAAQQQAGAADRPRRHGQLTGRSAVTAATVEPKPVFAVLGSGSWGTALAVHIARTGHRTILWGIETDELAAMTRDRENRRYLPGRRCPTGSRSSPTFERAVAQADQLLVVVPSHAFREVLRAGQAAAAPRASGSPGPPRASNSPPASCRTRWRARCSGPAVPTAVLSDPTFAKEVGAGLPSAMTVASRDEDYAMSLARSLSSDNFRVYASGDMVGVEVGGATKNVLAIGAGISDGLGFGANTRVALITRGLVELTRLGVALGADKETFMGLAGLGDLVLTCTDDQSRNRRFGLALASGKTPEQAQAEIGQVVEGVLAARAVREVARRVGVEMPISEQVYRVLYEGAPARDAVFALMGRTVKTETA